MYSGSSGSACGSVSPFIAIRERRTKSPTSEAFQSLHTPGPVANESASVSACSTSSSTGSPSSASQTAVMVCGSFRSCRIATLANSRWWNTSLDSISMSDGHMPSLVPIWVASCAPSTQWSVSRPLPMSCNSAARINRSDRATRVVKILARETVSERWRSTVQMWTTSRGGRSRTAPHSGKSRPHSPVRSRVSMTAMVSGPAANMTRRLSNASRGHGVGSSGAVSASRVSVDTEIGKPVTADAAATRSSNAGSLCGRASRASTISPAYSTTPSSSGRRGRRRIADIPRRGKRIGGGPQPGVDAIADGASHVGEHSG